MPSGFHTQTQNTPIKLSCEPAELTDDGFEQFFFFLFDLSGPNILKSNFVYNALKYSSSSRPYCWFGFVLVFF